MTMGRIDQRAHFELLEPNAQDPVSRCTPERPEPVPTGHRFTIGLWRNFWGGYVLVDVHGFVAVVVFGVA